MENWKPYDLGDILTLKRGYDLPDRLRKKGYYPVISSSGTSDYHAEFKLEGPGVITGRYGTLGKIHYAENKYWPLNTTLYVKDFKGNSPKFIYYFLQTLNLEEFNGAAAVPGLDRNVLHRIKCLFPNEYKIQEQISSILGAYDELIEANNQRVKLLEETARELYKEWFVRMRFPGYKKAKFTKGIPTNWDIKPIGKVIDYHIGGGWGSDKRDNEFAVSGYVIRGTDIPGVKIGKANTEVYRFHKASNIKSRQLQEGDIVFETAGGSEGQPLGRTCYITNEILESYGDKVIAASFCKQIRTTSIPSLYLYYFLNYLYDTGMIESFQTQSTGISNYQFEPFLKFQQIILPKTELMQSFHDKVLLMQRQIAVLGQQNTQLRQIRDRLLPRLISGKLQVKTEQKEAKVIALNKTKPNQQTGAGEAEQLMDIHFKRTVLAACFIDKLKDEPTFGRMKLMKMLYLCEYVLGIDMDGNYLREAAGPYDKEMMRLIESELKKLKWFQSNKGKDKVSYHQLDNKDGFQHHFSLHFSDYMEGISELLQIFGKRKSEKAGMVATVHKAYRDLQLNNRDVSEDTVVWEVLNKWHKSKKLIPEKLWRACYSWMLNRNWIG